MKMKLVIDQDGHPEVHIQPCRLTGGKTMRFTANPALETKAQELEDVVERANAWAYQKEVKQGTASEPKKGG